MFWSASASCPVFMQPRRESLRFQSLLCLLHGEVSAFKVRNRCFLSSRGFICLVHTFSRQLIATLIYTVLFHWWDNNSRSTSSHKMVAEEETWLNLITPSFSFPSPSLFHLLPAPKQYSQLGQPDCFLSLGVCLVICNLRSEETGCH